MTQMNLKAFTLALLLLLATAPTLAATLSGKVVRVADGDTNAILTPEKEEVKIRRVENRVTLQELFEDGTPLRRENQAGYPVVFFSNALLVFLEPIGRGTQYGEVDVDE